MKIIYCIAGTYRPAGMERVLANKTRALAAMGHDILVVTTEQKGRPPAFSFAPSVRFTDLAVGYEDNNGGSFLDKLVHYPRKQRLHRKRLESLLMAEKADVVVSMFCGEETFLPGIKDGSRKVLEIHFSRFKRLQYGRKGLWALADRLRSRSDLRNASRFDRFVVLTEEDRAFWKGLDNITVIPNARTFTFPEPAPLSSRKVVALGRYSRQKGLDMLLEAWRLVCDKVGRDALGWQLHLVGDGEMRPSLERQVEEYGIGSTVFLDGWTDDVEALYMDTSVIALSSRYEGLPMVLLESQSAGVPSVCFECKCGPKDVIEDGVNGLLVPEGDVPRFAQSLLRLMEDPDLLREMGLRAYRMSGRWSEEAVMEKWKELFESL